MKVRLILAFLSLHMNLNAQDSSNKHSDPVAVNGYAEGYYAYDFNKPADDTRPPFVFNHNRHNEFNVNLAFLKAAFTGNRIRSNLALAAGTYMNANYAAEPGVLKNIYEADVGYQLLRNKNLWLDLGIMPSHVGAEGAVSKDCWTLTRSMIADNTPYFESGAKLGYTTANGKWTIGILALNGWQRITRLKGNSLMSWGTQVQFKPTDKIIVNWSTFLGTDKPDVDRLWRYYHNLYGIFQITNQIGVMLDFDFASEQAAKGSSEKNHLYAPLAIVKYSFSSGWAIAARVEYYNDPKGILIGTGTPNGFNTTGASLNVDYSPSSNALLRVEFKRLNSRDPIFVKGNNRIDHDEVLTTSMAISF